MKLKLAIEGMHCASCASNIERALKKISAIKSVSVSILTRKAIIKADDNINKDEIIKTINKIGYKAINIE